MSVAPLRALAGAVALLTAVGAALVGAAPADAAADPTCLAVAHHQDASHTGSSCAVRTSPKLATAWTANLQAPAQYPLVAAGRVFVTTSKPGGPYGGTLWALDLKTGAPVWGPIPLSGTYFTFNLAYADGRVFVSDFDGTVIAFAAANGRQLWTAQTDYFSGEPVVFGGVVYLHDAHNVFALDARTGRRVWASPSLDGDQSAVAVDTTGVYVNGGCSRYRLSLSTGAIVWSGNTGCHGGGGGVSYLSGGRFFETTGHTILNAANGNVLGSFAGSPAFSGGVGYFTSGTNLFAQRVADRTPVYSVTLPSSAVGSPVVAGNVVYVAGANNKLYGIDAATGTVVQTTTLGAAPTADFAIGLGRVVVPTATGVTVLI